MIQRIVLGISLLCLSSLLLAQQTDSEGAEPGLIQGIITDVEDRNAPIKDAEISYSHLKGEAKGTVTSDSQGRYRIEPLPAGQYSFSVKAEGYKPRASLLTVVMAGRESVFNIPLRPKPSLIGGFFQNRIALVMSAFLLGLMVGLLIGVLRSK